MHLQLSAGPTSDADEVIHIYLDENVVKKLGGREFVYTVHDTIESARDMLTRMRANLLIAGRPVPKIKADTLDLGKYVFQIREASQDDHK